MDSVGKIGLIIPEIIDQLDYELLSGIVLLRMIHPMLLISEITI